MKALKRFVFLFVIAFCIFVTLVACMQRRLLFFPSHFAVAEEAAQAGMTRWEIEGEYTGYARIVKEPRKIWFFTHGNGGQAGNRDYVLTRIHPNDSVYILEYPGYGEREGSPSRASIDAAATKAYLWLVKQYGVDRLVVLGESMGSGPASQLAQCGTPPKQIVLVVPFDAVADVAQEKYRIIPVKLLMLDKWDNIASLQGYKGRLDIFGAHFDGVIPVHHARALAKAIPGAVYHEFEGGHSWSQGDQVKLYQM